MTGSGGFKPLGVWSVEPGRYRRGRSVFGFAEFLIVATAYGCARAGAAGRRRVGRETRGGGFVAPGRGRVGGVDPHP